MRQTHAVEIQHTAENLKRRACDFFLAHLTSHDRGEEVIRRVLHDFEPLALFVHNVDGLDNVAVVKCRSDAKLGRDFLVVVLFVLVHVAISKLLHSEDGTVAGALHKTHGATSARAKHLAKLAVLRLQSMIVRERYTRRAGLVPSTGFGLVMVVRVVVLILVLVAKFEEALEIRLG